jgi:hypothetical protein
MSIENEAKVTFDPEFGRRGERVKLQIEYGDAGNSGEALERSIMRISDYGIYDAMKREGDRLFSWTYVIPWEAPPRVYDIEMYAIDNQGNKGPITTAHYQIKA